MTRLLLTGFEPFDGAAANVSWDVVQAVAREWDGPELATERLPVEFRAAPAAAIAAAERHRASTVIAIGLAEGRDAITPERIAINVRDARIPDNAGAQPVDEAIDPHGPDGVFSSLPLRAILADLAAADLPAHLSNSAGTYVCNDVFYSLVRWAAGRQGARAGFVHLPQATEFARSDEPRLPMARLIEAVQLIARRASRADAV